MQGIPRPCARRPPASRKAPSDCERLPAALREALHDRRASHEVALGREALREVARTREASRKVAYGGEAFDHCRVSHELSGCHERPHARHNNRVPTSEPCRSREQKEIFHPCRPIRLGILNHGYYCFLHKDILPPRVVIIGVIGDTIVSCIEVSFTVVNALPLYAEFN